MEYYFAKWEDSEDVFTLMEEWWYSTNLTGTPNIDKGMFKALFDLGRIICLVARKDDKLVGCFVGILAEDMFRKGDMKIEQMAACFSEEYRTLKNYKDMMATVEKVADKFNINRVVYNVLPRVGEILSKKGYTKDSIVLTKEI